jgi:hypothetical protein
MSDEMRVERMSPELRQSDVLDALGNSELTIGEIYNLLRNVPGWRMEDGSGYARIEAKKSLVYTTVERLRWTEKIVRIPTGKGRPRWKYAKADPRPLHGEIAELEKQFPSSSED